MGAGGGAAPFNPARQLGFSNGVPQGPCEGGVALALVEFVCDEVRPGGVGGSDVVPLVARQVPEVGARNHAQAPVEAVEDDVARADEDLEIPRAVAQQHDADHEEHGAEGHESAVGVAPDVVLALLSARVQLPRHFLGAADEDEGTLAGADEDVAAGHFVGVLALHEYGPPERGVADDGGSQRDEGYGEDSRAVLADGGHDDYADAERAREDGKDVDGGEELGRHGGTVAAYCYGRGGEKILCAFAGGRASSGEGVSWRTVRVCHVVEGFVGELDCELATRKSGRGCPVAGGFVLLCSRGGFLILLPGW